MTTLREGCTSCETVASNDLERRVIGLISHSVLEILSKGGKEMISVAYYSIDEFLLKT